MTAEQVLIIDDSIAIASLLANEILPLGGYQATAALSGEEGVELARDMRPDLVLCDLEMPGINGLDVLRKFKELDLDPPTIMMTAFGSEAIAAQALRMGVKGYIIKPFTTEEILAAVERAMIEPRLLLKLEELDTKLEEYQRMMLIIQAVSNASAGGLEPKALMSRIILAAVYGSGANSGYIAAFDSTTSKISVESAVNLQNWQGKDFKSNFESAMKNRAHEKVFTRTNEDEKFWFHVPLMRKDKTMGVISVEYPQDKLPAQTEQLFSALAGYASFALENRILFKKIDIGNKKGEH